MFLPLCVIGRQAELWRGQTSCAYNIGDFVSSRLLVARSSGLGDVKINQACFLADSYSSSATYLILSNSIK